LVKHVLHSAADELDFFLLGIRSAEDQYRIASLINDALGIDLSLNSFIPFNLKSGKSFNFSLFGYIDEELGIQYNLIPNSSNFGQPGVGAPANGTLFSEGDIDESVKLIKELPKTDYFLILKGEDLHLHRFKVTDLLKNVTAILQVQPIEAAELPSRRNLIF
jgi:hypothetical protein